MKTASKLFCKVGALSENDTFTGISPTLKRYGLPICSMKDKTRSNTGLHRRYSALYIVPVYRSISSNKFSTFQKENKLV